MAEQKDRQGLSDKQKKMLKSYGTWRPRLGRGAQWAGTAGLISGVATRASKNSPAVGKIVAPVAIGAGLAGIGDKILEEKVEKNREAKKLVGGGFDKKAFSTEDTREGIDGRPPWGSFTSDAEKRSVSDNEGLVEQLFSQKARTAALAQSQLRSLFPDAKEEEYSRAIGLPQSASGKISKIRKVLGG
jgi:hypothetical protein